MIKEINMPMMAPAEGGSSSESELTWDDIPAAGPCDIQSGRNVYIELNEDQTCTKASAGKILQFIKEGFMPVFISHTPNLSSMRFEIPLFRSAELPGSPISYWFDVVSQLGTPVSFYAYSDALDKPFTTAQRQQSVDINNPVGGVGGVDGPSIH